MKPAVPSKRAVRRFLSLAIILLVLLPPLPYTTSAEDYYGDYDQFIAPITPVEYLPDYGEYIEISNRAGLEAIASNLSGKYYLSADIDLSGADWTPIGESTPFSGVFDGQGHVISSLMITGEAVVGTTLSGGLFANILGGVICNVMLDEIGIDLYITSDTTAYVGGICGNAAFGEIYNCISTGVIGVTSSSTYLGGICGYAVGCVLEKSYSNTSFFSTATTGTSSVAGICGGSYSGEISICYSLGTVTSHSFGHTFMGGICGIASATGITFSFNAGELDILSSYGAFVGGIAGINGDSTEECYNVGSIIVRNSFESYAGGLCGICSGKANNSYSSCSVTASSSDGTYIGGVCGVNEALDPDFCAAVWNNSSNQSIDGSTLSTVQKQGVFTGPDETSSRSASEMKDRSSYASNYVGFDFTSVWGFKDGENDGYPILRAFYPAIEGRSIDRKTLSMEVGDAATLVATVTPDNGIYPLATWYTSNAGVVTVSNGVVTAISAGSAEVGFITATPTNDGGSNACTVTVTAKKTNNIVITGPVTTTAPEKPVDAQEPEITSQPKDAWTVLDIDVALSVTAAVSDGGSLSYQWYKNASASNSGGVRIAGATDSILTPETDELGTYYYYVVLTNTNDEATGEKIAAVTSDFATVTVEEPISNTNGQLNGIIMTATVTQIGVEFEWTPANNPLGYRIYKATEPSGEGASISYEPILGSGYFDINIEPDTWYYYTIAAVLNVENALSNGEQADYPSWDSKTMGPKSEEIAIIMSFIEEDDEEVRGFMMLTIGDPYMRLNEKTIEIDPGRGTTPIISGGRTMLPIRAIIEGMGGEIFWDETDRLVSVHYGDDLVKMWIGMKGYTVNGVEEEMDVAPFMHNDRTMLPVRFVAESLGCPVEWIGALNKVVIVYIVKGAEEKIE